MDCPEPVTSIFNTDLTFSFKESAFKPERCPVTPIFNLKGNVFISDQDSNYPESISGFRVRAAREVLSLSLKIKWSEESQTLYLKLYSSLRLFTQTSVHSPVYSILRMWC